MHHTLQALEPTTTRPGTVFTTENRCRLTQDLLTHFGASIIRRLEAADMRTAAQMVREAIRIRLGVSGLGLDRRPSNHKEQYGLSQTTTRPEIALYTPEDIATLTFLIQQERRESIGDLLTPTVETRELAISGKGIRLAAEARRGQKSIGLLVPPTDLITPRIRRIQTWGTHGPKPVRPTLSIPMIDGDASYILLDKQRAGQNETIPVRNRNRIAEPSLQLPETDKKDCIETFLAQFNTALSASLSGPST